ncbi:MAG TPA: hypothetical protein PKA03_09980, partial [Tabrizicola sp.]|nr:hypothetical protein [Tabrizicola sp.]
RVHVSVALRLKGCITNSADVLPKNFRWSAIRLAPCAVEGMSTTFAAQKAAMDTKTVGTSDDEKVSATRSGGESQS